MSSPEDYFTKNMSAIAAPLDTNAVGSIVFYKDTGAIRLVLYTAEKHLSLWNHDVLRRLHKLISDGLRIYDEQ